MNIRSLAQQPPQYRQWLTPTRRPFRYKKWVFLCLGLIVLILVNQHTGWLLSPTEDNRPINHPSPLKTVRELSEGQEGYIGLSAVHTGSTRPWIESTATVEPQATEDHPLRVHVLQSHLIIDPSSLSALVDPRPVVEEPQMTTTDPSVTSNALGAP